MTRDIVYVQYIYIIFSRRSGAIIFSVNLICRSLSMSKTQKRYLKNAPSIPIHVIKRDGRTVDFDRKRIEDALWKCFMSNDIGPSVTVEEIADKVLNIISGNNDTPSVEEIQDTVETVLLSCGEYEAARHFIRYRAEHEKMRDERPIPENVRLSFADAKKYFPTPLQEFQYYDKYSRFDWEKGRRETWVETVDRTVDYLYELAGDRVGRDDYESIRKYILEMKVMPSMRLLAMAGPAARRNNITIYNCAASEADSIDSFCEALLISMCGTGYGFSVERRCVEKLPRVKRQIGASRSLYVVEDTTEGWVDALRYGLEHWFDGHDVDFDYSQIRPAGMPLRIKGGTAPGSAPLRQALSIVRGKILARQGNVVRPIDAHDIMTAIGGCAVSGGVRRSSMISLFDIDDYEMLNCKSGNFEIENSQRWNANNSAVWNGEISQRDFMRQFVAMVESGNGEPGIFNRKAAYELSPERRTWVGEPLTNPCGEALLYNQFCNLSQAIARSDDTYDFLYEKVRLAAIIGTIQSLATYFPGLRDEWKINTERDRLLGVDIAAQMDSPASRSPEVKEKLRNLVVMTNNEYSKKLGINQSVSTTVCKPGGNSSVLLNAASGIHARWSKYYVRNVRVSAYSPIFKVLRDAGAPMDPENGQNEIDANTWVIHFPVKSPDGAITRNDRTAIEQCEYWLENKLYWTEMNPSVTITYKPDEAIDVMQWVWNNRKYIGGMAFLPSFDADEQYEQLPYIEITEEEYEHRAANFPTIDWSKIYYFETTDQTLASSEFACLSGTCDFQL